ncbi:cytidylyltransferase [Hirsutella rhossiliensis]|uniref:Cytidylyltransferase n=1 Tax=Hirsutella rhossiliensis TaxID=111463 RepID=A0A9P8N1F2_9HYPO|nr:cytidylyltransferase [Hirsutella rhossiliensis]KAH0964837.1 cytidylyltransferase [Hirsutella rhossiliensis]
MATDSSPGSAGPHPPSLLLLPAPPRPAAARHLLGAAYRAPLTAVLTRLSQQYARQEAPGPAPVLVVAVAGSSILAASSSSAETDAKAEMVRWKPAQSLLARLYAIIASICAERDIAAHLGSHEPGSVDARVVLVHWSGRAEQPGLPCRHGPAVLDLAAFAAQVRPWRTLFHTSCEPGCELLAAYLAHAEGGQKLLPSQICAVDGDMTFSGAGSGTGSGTGSGAEVAWEKDGVGGYSTVCLGGTFDHLHPGHKLLLEAAALLLAVPDSGVEPCTMIVGISGDELLTKKEYASELQPWEVRARSVVAFLSTALSCAPTTAAAPVTRVPTTPGPEGGSSAAPELHAALRDGAVLVRCVDIRDPFGPTVTEERIGAIVVSGETRSGGQAINDRRTARGWALLDVYEIDVLDATGTEASDGGEGGGADREARLAAKISSTEIRRRKALGRDGQGKR